MQHTTINKFTPYKVNVKVLQGKNLRKIEKSLKMNLESDFLGVSLQLSTHKYAMVFAVKKLRVSLIAHEVSHLLDIIYEEFEKEISFKGNSEARAMLTEKIVRKIVKTFKKQIVLG